DDVVLIRDLLHSSYAQTDPNVNHYGLQTYFGRAVKFNGVAVGSLCLVYGHDYQPDVDDQHLLGVMAAAIGVEEQRRQAEQRLKERDVQLTQAATLAKVAYWEFDYATALFTFNDQFYAVINTSVEKVGGYTMPAAQYLTQFVHPDDKARLLAQIEAERDAAPGLGRTEYRAIDGNGDSQHVLVEYRLILNDQQRPFKVYGAHLDITELKRVEEARARYAQHMAALYATSLEVNAQPDLPSLLKSIVERAADLLKAPMAGLYLVNPDSETLTLVVNLNINSVSLGIQLRFGEGVAGRVAQSGQPLMIDDYRAWAGRSPHFTNPEFTRVLGVPLKSGQRVIGVIDIDDPQPGAFSAEDVRLVSLFADQAAIAIEKARLLQEVVTTADRRTILYRAVQAIGASVDREPICLAIHQAVAQVMPAEAVLIALVVHDPAKAEPDIEEVYLYDAGQRWPSERYPLHQGGFTRYIITSNRAMLIENFNDPQVVQQTGATDWGDVTERPLAAAAVPLRLGDNVIGMLSVQSNAPHRYTAEDQNLLEMLAAYSATAFEKARLFDQVQRHVTDLEERVAKRTRELTIANDQLAAANTRLTELDRLKDQFISRISHELRTPLASIKIYLELLGQAVPEKREKYLRTLQQETDRLHRLIEDLLNYTELKLVLAETDLKPIDLNQFASIIVQEYAPIAAQQGLTMTLELQPGLPFVIGDSGLIRQIVVNLINNALNYSGSGVITVRTQARTVADAPRITISVQDSGPGITQKDLPHLFERFYRGEAARNYKIPGTGLGLAIAHDIATALGGEVTVESVPGKGATFTVWLRMMSDE
ncbi:MAG: GAF domain-containing protein, partial [Thermoflexales bacterium]|nr:GAF domain-containing protein [Thermoflexales bacterium]